MNLFPKRKGDDPTFLLCLTASIGIIIAAICTFTKFPIEGIAGILVLLCCISTKQTYAEFSSFLTAGAYFFILFMSVKGSEGNGNPWLFIIMVVIGAITAILTLVGKGFEEVTDFYSDPDDGFEPT